MYFQQDLKKISSILKRSEKKYVKIEENQKKATKKIVGRSGRRRKSYKDRRLEEDSKAIKIGDWKQNAKSKKNEKVIQRQQTHIIIYETQKRSKPTR